MSTQNINVIFNISGNANEVVSSVAHQANELNTTLSKTTNFFNSWRGTAVAFQQVSQAVQNLKSNIDAFNASGLALDTSLADLSAITGETGESIKLIEGYARESAKTFGGSAAQAVESYKLLLSQLTPELAKTPDALKAMGDNIAVLSKTMGGNTTAAAEVLTTAMNQYGVSMENPTAAAAEMARMMNVMAAAGREGSAELPTIKAALEQCGMAAKVAGVSFEETNSAIQLLDKAGKKGSEGGVALRNVMTTLARGRFLPKDVQEELAAAGVNVNVLTDKSTSLSSKLKYLQPLMNDTALFTKLFGRENASAALALVQGTAELDRCTEAITGTNTAFEQADIVMDSYAEKQARIQAKIDDVKISLFNLTGGLGIWSSAIAGALVPLAQLAPLVTVAGQAFGWLRVRVVKAYTSIMLHNGYLSLGQVANLGFARNVLQAAVALVRFATVGVFNAVKGIGAYILSLVTGGTASAGFSATARTSFAAFRLSAVSACRAVGFAIKSIPIIGWIAALIGVVVVCWNKFAGFRAFILTMWDAIKGFGNVIKEYVLDRIRGIVEGVGALGSAISKLFKGDFSGAWDAAKTGVVKIAGVEAAANARNNAKSVASATKQNFSSHLEKERAKDAKKDAEKKSKESTDDVSDDLLSGAGLLGNNDNNNPIGGAIDGIGGKAAADNAGKIKNINVTIDSVVKNFTISTTNLREDLTRVKQMVGEVLIGAVNDLNYAV